MNAQHYETTVNYTVEDGLPSNTIYAIEQDSLGYIWLGTDKGLSRFDGTEFINYTESDGLTDSEILKFYKDPENRIWYYTLNGKIGFIKNGKIHNQFRGSAIDIGSRVQSIFFFQGDLFTLSNSINTTANIDVSNTHPTVRAFIGDEQNLYLLSFYSIYYLDSTSSTFKEIPISNKTSGSSLKTEYEYATYVNKFILSYRTRRFLTSKTQSLLYTFNTTNNRLDSISFNNGNILNIKKATDSTAYYFTTQGVFSFNPKSAAFININSYDYATDYLIDDYGNRWTTTYQNGLFLDLANKEIKQIYKSTGFKSSFEIDSIKYLVSKDDLIYTYSDSVLSHPILRQNQIELIHPTSFKDPLYIGRYGYYYKKDHLNAYLSAYTIHSDTLSYYRANKIVQCKITRNGLDEIRTLPTLKKGIIKKFISMSSNDFLAYDDREILQFNYANSSVNSTVVDSRINHLSIDEKQRIWIGTNGNGVFYVKDEKDTVHFNSALGLGNDFIKSISHQTDIAWVLHNNGIDLIEVNKPIEQAITHVKPIPGNIYHISSSKNGILATTSKGIFEVTNDYPLNIKKTPQVNLDWIKTDKTKFITSKENLDFIPSTQQIQIKFSSPYWQHGQSIVYRYKLAETTERSQWIQTSKNLITSDNLKHGKYTLEIQARANNTNWSESFLLHFEMRPYWYEQAWLKWLFAFLSSLLLITIFGRIRSSIHYRKRLKSEKLFADLSARKAQFKSHFVFNSINSVRNYLLNNDQKTSDDYLVAYSKLMRKMLDVSNKVLIPLNEELELIEYYMSLEQMRLRHQFEYQIEISKDIRTADLKCPAMITQVFVENAIWHGIMPLNDTGFINIFIALQQQDHYVIRITDDGVGFDKTDIKQKDQTSWGTSIVKDKIKLIKETYDVDLKIEIDSNKGVGTEVSITLPISFS